MRQLIIVRKDLNMGIGKLAAQCCHASNAYFMHLFKGREDWLSRTPVEPYASHLAIDEDGKPFLYRLNELSEYAQRAVNEGKMIFFTKFVPYEEGSKFGKLEWADPEEVKFVYSGKVIIPSDVYENWVNDIYTKTVCEARNKNHLLKAVAAAQELGLREDEDFFLIKDRCLTELEPEETDENGVGYTLTCIGFKPLEDEIAHTISKKYQLLK